MAIVLTSTTEPQENLDHAASEKWREAPKPKPEPAPEPEAPEQEPVEVPEEPAEPAAEPEPETEVESKTAKAEAKEHKPSRKEQARIDELTKRWKIAEAEKETAKRELAIARGEIQAEPSATEPVWEEYQAQGRTHEEWVAHHDDWKRAEYDFNQMAMERNRKGQAKYKDWDNLQKQVKETADVTFPPLVGNAINRALIEEENAADVVYYLWNHVDEGHQLAAMPPDRAGRYIAKLAAKLELSSPVDKSVPVVPKAKVVPPAPITPVTSSGTKTSTPLEKMSIKEFMKVRNKEEIANRKRF